MTIVERVLASRLIEEIGSHENYAKQIGVNGQLIAVSTHAADNIADFETLSISVETSDAKDSSSCPMSKINSSILLV